MLVQNWDYCSQEDSMPIVQIKPDFHWHQSNSAMIVVVMVPSAIETRCLSDLVEKRTLVLVKRSAWMQYPKTNRPPDCFVRWMKDHGESDFVYTATFALTLNNY